MNKIKILTPDEKLSEDQIQFIKDLLNKNPMNTIEEFFEIIDTIYNRPDLGIDDSDFKNHLTDHYHYFKDWKEKEILKAFEYYEAINLEEVKSLDRQGMLEFEEALDDFIYLLYQDEYDGDNPKSTKLTEIRSSIKKIKFD